MTLCMATEVWDADPHHSLPYVSKKANPVALVNEAIVSTGLLGRGKLIPP